MGRYSAAVEYAEAALGREPGNQKALMRRAQGNRGLGLLDDAKADLERLRRLAPDSPLVCIAALHALCCALPGRVVRPPAAHAPSVTCCVGCLCVPAAR